MVGRRLPVVGRIDPATCLLIRVVILSLACLMALCIMGAQVVPLIMK